MASWDKFHIHLKKPISGFRKDSTFLNKTQRVTGGMFCHIQNMMKQACTTTKEAQLVSMSSSSGSWMQGFTWEIDHSTSAHGENVWGEATKGHQRVGRGGREMKLLVIAMMQRKMACGVEHPRGATAPLQRDWGPVNTETETIKNHKTIKNVWKRHIIYARPCNATTEMHLKQRKKIMERVHTNFSLT